MLSGTIMSPLITLFWIPLPAEGLLGLLLRALLLLTVGD